MNTILLSFAIVITLVNLALALSTFGYIVEMNKHMGEWFKMFKTLTEACSGLCEENGHVITSLMKHIEYTEKSLTIKEEEIQNLNDKYDKLYEEFINLKEEVDESTYHYIKDALNNVHPEEDYHKYVLKPPFLVTDADGEWIGFNRCHCDEENDDGLSSFWHEEKEEDIGGQND